MGFQIIAQNVTKKIFIKTCIILPSHYMSLYEQYVTCTDDLLHNPTKAPFKNGRALFKMTNYLDKVPMIHEY
jgi:hypothetical protein